MATCFGRARSELWRDELSRTVGRSADRIGPVLLSKAIGSVVRPSLLRSLGRIQQATNKRWEGESRGVGFG